VICAAVAAPAPFNLAHAAATEPAPFRREVRGVTLDVLPTDVTLTQAGEQRPFFSLRAFEAERLRRELDGDGAKGDLRDSDSMKGCVRTIEVVPLAFTGDLLSLRETSETICPREAHPAGEARFATFAITRASESKRKPGDTGAPMTTALVPLTEWVPAAALFTSLRRNALVRAALASASSPPTTLAELVAAAAESPPVVVEKKSCHAFPEDLLERFAPSHVEGGKLAVRLALPGAAVCRTQLTELGIVVPLPRPLRAALTEASAGRAGFLGRNAPRQLAARPTRLELKP
jgi:hypothetical protein